MAGEEYTIDLDRHGGIGECGCKRWSCDIWPLVRDGKHPVDLFDEAFSCAHIRAARRHQYELWFWRVMEDCIHENT